MFFSSIPYKVVMPFASRKGARGLSPAAPFDAYNCYSPETRKEQQQHHGAPYKVATNPPQNPPAVGRSCAWTDCFGAGQAQLRLYAGCPCLDRGQDANAPPLPSASSKTISLQQGGGTIVFQLQPTALAFGIHYRNRQSQRLHGRIQRNLPSRESGLCHPLDIHSAPPAGERCAQGYLLSFFSHLSFFL